MVRGGRSLAARAEADGVVGCAATADVAGRVARGHGTAGAGERLAFVGRDLGGGEGEGHAVEAGQSGEEERKRGDLGELHRRRCCWGGGKWAVGVMLSGWERNGRAA